MPHIFQLLACGIFAFGSASAIYAQEASVSDTYLWLEDIESTKALDWVKTQNQHTVKELAESANFTALESSLLAIYDSDARIPGVYKQGKWYYNFWRDKQHLRGIWRRTTLEEYRKAEPKWEVVLDLDAVNKAENTSWVWRGADCLRPEYRYCLIELSRGGGDATVTREYDLETKSWVKEGFSLPEAKGSLSWIDQDTVFVSTDFGKGSMTDSGYPRIVKRWKRGTPLASAETVFEGKAKDIGVGGYHDDTPGYERNFISRSLDMFRSETYLVADDGTLSKIEVPDSASVNIFREWLTIELREPWKVKGQEYLAGSLLATKFEDFKADKGNFQVLFEPSSTTSLAGYSWTQHYLILNVMDDVKNRLSILTPTEGSWTRHALKGLPEFGDIAAHAVDADDSDDVWITVTDYLTPTTLLFGNAGPDTRLPEQLKRQPDFFDASTHVVEQHFVHSQDGERVPYFIVRPKKLVLDGTAPTLLYGYGGFEVSLTPSYIASVGKAWLEKGGVYVVANIRGGGEYGPRWHQAALKQNRHRAYEDFAAVAQDLIERKITSPKHLGIEGGSNGGLLTGNMLVHYPQLFGAVVIEAPLLDMKRYNKLLAGASWMAEYGNPDSPEDWSYIQTFSPYQLFDASKDYPPVFLLSSTRDDRVHPGHARKMFAKLLNAGKDARYYENIEGGHGGAADNKQRAYMDALVYSFLWNTIGKK